MSVYLDFNFRQLAPNLSGATNINIPDSPATHLAASLKGGSAVVVPGANDVMKLSAVLGWVSHKDESTLRVSIYRGAPSAQGGTLIFSTLDGTDDKRVYVTTSLVHVDNPPTTGDHRGRQLLPGNQHG